MGLLGSTRLLAYIDQHLQQYHLAWQSATHQLHHASVNQLCEAIQRLWQEHSLTVQQLTSGPEPVLFGTTPLASRSLLIVTQYDRTGVAPTQLLSIIAYLSALDAYQHTIGPLPVTFKWLFCLKESSDYTSFINCTRQYGTLLAADACIWQETGLGWAAVPHEPQLALGTRGRLRVEMSVQTAQSALPTSYGAIAPNAGWRLLWALDSLKSVHEEILLEGFYDQLQPLDDAAVEDLAKLPEVTQRLTQEWGLTQTLLDIRGFQLHYAHLLTPTCTIAQLTIENQFTSEQVATLTIPTRGQALLDFHLVPAQDPEEIFALLQDHLTRHNFDDIVIGKWSTNAPIYTSIQHTFVQLLRHTLRAAYSKDLTVLPLVAESIPLAALYQIAPIPIVVATTAPAIPDGVQSLLPEEIQLTHFQGLVRHLTLLLWQLSPDSEQPSL